MQHIRAHVLICGGTGCKSAGSKEVQLAFSRAIEAKGRGYGSRNRLPWFL